MAATRRALLRLLRGACDARAPAAQPWARPLSTAAAAEVEELLVPPAAGSAYAEGLQMPPVIHVAYDDAEADLRALDLLPPPQQQPPDAPWLLGFDIEIRPMFTRNPPLRRAALVQLASPSACLLAHVYHMPTFPRRVAELIEAPSVWKVGTGVAQDLQRLATDYQLRPQGFVDLAVVAGLYRYARPGLKNMAAVFGEDVQKSKTVQLSNWELSPLRPSQVAYAAQDAALGLWLLRRLHGAHGGGASLTEWAAAFVNARTVGALAARRRGAAGCVLAPALAAHAAAEAAAAAERGALLRDRRCRAALARGAADPTLAVSALADVARARGPRRGGVLTMQKGHAAGDESTFTAVCALDGAPLAQGAGRSRALARRAAARAAIRLLAAQAEQLDAVGSLPPRQDAAAAA